jgi:hypothetical protein
MAALLEKLVERGTLSDIANPVRGNANSATIVRSLNARGVDSNSIFMLRKRAVCPPKLAVRSLSATTNVIP